MCQSSACTHTPSPLERDLPSGCPRAGEAPRDGLVSWDVTPRNSQETKIKINRKPCQSLGDTRATPSALTCMEPVEGILGKHQSRQRVNTPSRVHPPRPLSVVSPRKRKTIFAPSLVTSLKFKGWFNIARNIYCLSLLELTKYLKGLF